MSIQHMISSPVGKIGIRLNHHTLTHLEFLPNTSARAQSNHPLIETIANELIAYFKNPKHRFTLQIELQGTPFQKRVWQALQEIPSGETMTYGSLAKQLKTGPRAIGQACRTNRLPIIIPCHRIIAHNHMGGFAGNIKGPFAKIKQSLLQHERDPSS